MAFKRGHTPWNKGKINIYSEKTKEKISEALKGRKLSGETKQKMSKSRQGRKVFEETRNKISKAE